MSGKTDGWMRSQLEAHGVPAYGVTFKSGEMERLLRELGVLTGPERPTAKKPRTVKAHEDQGALFAPMKTTETER